MDYYKGTIPIIGDQPDAMELAFPGKAGEYGSPERGFGYVPRDFSIDPPEMFQAPSEMKIIPESEWDARYDEEEATQSSLEHLYLRGGNPAFVNLDQNGHGYCHTADTEVLTEKGFVAWPDYNWSDLLATVNPMTGGMEYQAPFERHVYDYDGPMVYSTNRRVDFGVTPDHQMYVRKWDERKRALSDSYSFVRAGDLGWYTGLMPAPRGWLGTEIVEVEVPGDRRYDGDDFFALLGLIVSDGYAGGSEGSRPGKGTKNWVSFASFREETRPIIAALAQRVGFREQPGRPGVWIRYDAGALAEWVRQNCYTSNGLKAQNKRVPALVKAASGRQIKHFLHYFDDRTREGNQFFTTSRRLADDLQELHLRIGKRACVDAVAARTGSLSGKTIRSGPSFTLTVGTADQLCLDRKKHIETDRYRGPVFCAAVPNHTLITRRNGTVLISSNCWAYSTGQALMLERLKQGLPLVRLNPHSTAAIIKGGRDEGGWCGLSAKFVREVGMAEEGNGPGQWPLHSRSLRSDTPETRARMALYKSQEEWVDLTRQVYDQNLTAAMIATCHFNKIPCPTDYNWWGHSVVSLRTVRVERGRWGRLILNSWKGWGRHGLAVLEGSKMNTMGALAIRMSKAS